MDLNLVEVWSISEAVKVVVKECLPFMMDKLCLAPPLGFVELVHRPVWFLPSHSTNH